MKKDLKLKYKVNKILGHKEFKAFNCLKVKIYFKCFKCFLDFNKKKKILNALLYFKKK